MIGKLPICLCEVSTLYCKKQNYFWYLFIYIPSTLCKMKSTCTHWTLASVSRWNKSAWLWMKWLNITCSVSGAHTQMYQSLYSGVSKNQVEHELVIAELSLIRSINILGDCWSRHNSLYETVWASRPRFPEFLLSSIYLWSWQVAVSRDGEAKYIAIINYLVMPLHLSCHPNIDKQD